VVFRASRKTRAHRHPPSVRVNPARTTAPPFRDAAGLEFLKSANKFAKIQANRV